MTAVRCVLIWAWLLCAAHVTACRDASDARSSSIETAQVLALEAEPPEAAPGEHVRYHVLAVDRGGEIDPADFTLAYCRTPSAETENRVASDACAASPEQAIATQGPDADATVSSDACALFGPSAPAGVRAPDPDATGGYYQPLRVEENGAVAVGLQRIRCALPDAPIDITRAFEDRYVANHNPVLSPLSMSVGGKAVAPDAVPRGQELRLRVAWPEDAVERFVVYDRLTVALIEQREAMRVSWFATAGELAYDHTGRAGDDTSRIAENRWRAPTSAGRVHLFIVLRDSRGGTTHAAYTLEVR